MTTMMKTLYFAYGSNMNNEQMAIHCPNAMNLGPAILEDWGLRARLHADVEECPGECVHGVLWGVTHDCIQSLDRYEGVPVYYVKKVVWVRMKGCAAQVKALVYVMNPKRAGEADGIEFTPNYANVCAQGASENGIKTDPLYRKAVFSK